MTQSELEALAAGLAPVIKDFVAKEGDRLRAEIATLRERIAFLEGKSGRDLAEGAETPLSWRSGARQ